MLGAFQISYKKNEVGTTLQLGHGAVLLNAGESTNFKFQICEFNPNSSELAEINSIVTKSKIKDRINAILTKGGRLHFIQAENTVFINNLALIDSFLSDIIAEVTKLFFSTQLISIKDLTDRVIQLNPLKYQEQYAHTFYEYKMKRFLTDLVCGMVPSEVWNGIYDASGGYSMVKENGEVLYYNIYNRNQFEDYLFANTKLETASSTRHDFGKIYEEKGRFFIKLNLQIRFK